MVHSGNEPSGGARDNSNDQPFAVCGKARGWRGHVLKALLS